MSIVEKVEKDLVAALKAQEALKLSGENFLFWGMDGEHDMFAGFTVTLESGFPDAAVRIVLASIPLVDDAVGDLLRYAE